MNLCFFPFNGRELGQNCCFSLLLISLSWLLILTQKICSIKLWYKEFFGLSNKGLALFFSLQEINWFLHLQHDFTRTGHVKIAKKFSNVLKVDNCNMSVGFCFFFVFPFTRCRPKLKSETYKWYIKLISRLVSSAWTSKTI